MSDYPMLISNKLHSFRNFRIHYYEPPTKKFGVNSFAPLNVSITKMNSIKY